MKLIRYDQSMLDPVQSFSELRSEMDRLFNFAFPAFSRSTRDYSFARQQCPVDLYRNGDEFIFRAEIPGAKKEDISLEVIDGSLIISGHFAQEEKNKEKESSRTETRFTRSISLPAQVDLNAIKASYIDGILEVRLPQKEEAKPKQIKIDVK